MYKMTQGRGSLKFGDTEKRISLNWASLVVSIVVAILTWVGVEAAPHLEQYGGWIAGVAGLAAQLIPVIIAYLKSNKDLTFDKPVDPSKKEG